MLMITGDTRSKAIVANLQRLGWGRMWIDRKPTPYDGEPWGFDNGAFRDWVNGQMFDVDAYLRRFERAYAVGMPYLAVAPDLVAQGRRSLDCSLLWLGRLPADWPWYLAVQDGMSIADIEPVIDQFAGIFLGGTSAFKATAWHWSQLAHRHGKLFHYGRAGTKRKLRHALEVKADSADSAFPLWSETRLDETIDFLIKPLISSMFAPFETALLPDTFTAPQ